MAPYDRNSGSNKTGQAALPHKNIQFGAMTKKQYDKYHNKVNFKSQFTIADYSDVFINCGNCILISVFT